MTTPKTNPPGRTVAGLHRIGGSGIVGCATKRQRNYTYPVGLFQLKLFHLQLSVAARGAIVCGPCQWMPLKKAGRFAIANCGPFTHKPGARKAGEADRRNRKALIAKATGPRNGFLISHSSPPARHVRQRGCRKAGQWVRLVLCQNYGVNPKAGQLAGPVNEQRRITNGA